MEDNCVGTTVNICLGMPTDHIRELYFQSCEYVTYEVSDVVTLRETQIEFQESDLGPVWPQLLGNDLADRSSLSFMLSLSHPSMHVCLSDSAFQLFLIKYILKH